MNQPQSSLRCFAAQLSWCGLALSIFMSHVSACASSAPALRSSDEGDALARLVAHMDNCLTILERAKGVEEAKRELERYCGPNRERISEIMERAARQALEDEEASSARAEELKKGIDHRRRAEAIEARPGWRGELWKTLEAVDACVGRRATEPGDEVPDKGGEDLLEKVDVDRDSPLGITACDRFVEKYTACIAELPEPARQPWLHALDAMRDGWRELAGTSRAELSSACVAESVRFRQSMREHCPSVVWD